MSYKLLVVDLKSPEISLGALRKIIRLVHQGATVVLGQTIPKHTPGLKNYPKGDSDILDMVNQLWGSNPKKFKKRGLGKGRIYSNVNLQQILKGNNILPDFQGPFEYIHRSDKQKDIYFIAGEGSKKCIFRVKGKRPEIWDPKSGKVKEVLNYHFTRDGRTVVPIDLPKNGSVFIVFRRKAHEDHFTSITGPEIPQLALQKDKSLKMTSWKNGKYILMDTNHNKRKVTTKVEEPVKLKGPWKVIFEPAIGGNNIKKTFKDLRLWNKEDDSEIKYFSGNARYKIPFKLTKKQTLNPACLQLGRVFDIAQVWINNKDLGIVWAEPWSIELSDVLREGLNHLEVEVTNCWRNKLIGAAGLPPSKRKVQTNVRLVPNRDVYKKSYEAYAATDPLSPSGLLGPVLIEFGKSENISI
jgi:hypothetical protein